MLIGGLVLNTELFSALHLVSELSFVTVFTVFAAFFVTQVAAYTLGFLSAKVSTCCLTLVVQRHSSCCLETGLRFLTAHTYFPLNAPGTGGEAANLLSVHIR